MITELAGRNVRTAVKENCFAPTCDVSTVIMLTGCARRYLDRLNESSDSHNFDEMSDSSEEINAWEN